MKVFTPTEAQVLDITTRCNASRFRPFLRPAFYTGSAELEKMVVTEAARTESGHMMTLKFECGCTEVRMNSRASRMACSEEHRLPEFGDYVLKKIKIQAPQDSA